MTELLGDHPHYIDDFARGADGKVSRKSPAAENDALVGFGWGHDAISREMPAHVNRFRP